MCKRGQTLSKKMAEGDLHSYVCDESSQESASDSEDFLEGIDPNACISYATTLRGDIKKYQIIYVS